jgi:hypothetical protein
MRDEDFDPISEDIFRQYETRLKKSGKIDMGPAGFEYCW